MIRMKNAIAKVERKSVTHTYSRAIDPFELYIEDFRFASINGSNGHSKISEGYPDFGL